MVGNCILHVKLSLYLVIQEVSGSINRLCLICLHRDRGTTGETNFSRPRPRTRSGTHHLCDEAVSRRNREIGGADQSSRLGSEFQRPRQRASRAKATSPEIGLLPPVALRAVLAAGNASFNHPSLSSTPCVRAHMRCWSFWPSQKLGCARERPGRSDRVRLGGGRTPRSRPLAWDSAR